jgi:hypothetical protein
MGLQLFGESPQRRPAAGAFWWFPVPAVIDNGRMPTVSFYSSSLHHQHRLLQ